MKETTKLYYTDAYIREFEAVVSSVRRRGDGVTEIILDRTAFFPEAGGQSADRGVIAGLNVTDVQTDDSGIITHYCLQENPSVAVAAAGERVFCSIDWERRHTFMQHHTGEHIFSGLVNRRFGYDNVGFHLSDNICTMDYNGMLLPEDVRRLEYECNDQIYRNSPVSCSFPQPEELERLNYRCKGELAPPIRIVEVEGADVCACCAPHVRSTGEIGILKVVETKSYKKGVRITILCGRKAFADYENSFGILGDCKRLLSSGTDELPERIASLQEVNSGLKYELTSLYEKNLLKDAATIPDSEDNPILFTGSAGTKAMRNTVNTLMEKHQGICGVFCGSDGDGYEFILGSTNVDMMGIAAIMREELVSKCGGSPRMIQGHTGAVKRKIKERLSCVSTTKSC